MSRQWNNQEQLACFVRLWERKTAITKKHTKEIWDQRAKNWEGELRSDEASQQRSDRRVAAAAEFLRAHGLLGPDCTAIDIGCGPGRFVAEFARTAKYVVGTDLSPQMIDYAAGFAREQGLNNTSFVACDFKQADVDQLGWKGRFDLVFSSITPAVSSYAGLEKAMSMSRGWCFNGSFLSSRSELLERVARQVFGKAPPSRWDGRTSYALFNVLWLRGWQPYVTYYTEQGVDRRAVDLTLAASLTENLGFGRDDREKMELIYRFLVEHADGDGTVSFPFENTYIWLLWDVRNRSDRSSYDPPQGEQR